MNKVILKSALITIATLAVAALLVFSMWILCSPQSMATACEKTGNYSFAVTCASLRYKYTDDICDLARCVEDGILSGEDKHIINFGETLIADKDLFESLCEVRDKELSESNYGNITLSYKAYICGHLAAAQYRTENADKAIVTAEFGGAQAFTKLILEVIKNNDRTAADKIISSLKNLGGTDENIQGLLAILENIK